MRDFVRWNERGLWSILIAGTFFSARALVAETLTIATYNIENYGPADRMTEAGYRKDYPKPELEKQALRTVLLDLRADVIALQEMGDAVHLEELRHDLQTQGANYPSAILLEASDPDRHVALLSKRPLKRVTPHTDLSFPYFGARENVKRGLLEVTLETASGELTLFVVHLKSRFSDRADDPLSAIRRAAEATAVRDRVLERFPAPANARFIILGDCNDDKTSKALAHLQSRGKTTLAVALPVADSRGETWTHAYRKLESYTHVDHVLVSPALRAAVIGGAAKIYDGPGVGEASDHRPVVFTLVFEAKETKQ